MALQSHTWTVECTWNSRSSWELVKSLLTAINKVKTIAFLTWTVSTHDANNRPRNSGPWRASLGPRRLRSLTRPPAGCLTLEGSRGPSDTAGLGVVYPLTHSRKHSPDGATSTHPIKLLTTLDTMATNCVQNSTVCVTVCECTKYNHTAWSSGLLCRWRCYCCECWQSLRSQYRLSEDFTGLYGVSMESHEVLVENFTCLLLHGNSMGYKTGTAVLQYHRDIPHSRLHRPLQQHYSTVDFMY